MGRRTLYKLELISVKYTPILMVLVSVLNVILAYFDIFIYALNVIAGNSVLSTIPMYISSYAYKFCKYHRMFINYLVVSNIILLYDDAIPIPVSDLEFITAYMAVFGIFMFITLYLYLKYGDRQDK